MVISYEERTYEIIKKINEAARRSGRQGADIRLMAVTKTRSTHEITEMAKEAGVFLFGENRIQEAQPKIDSWPSEIKVEWHLVGHLQRNKARKAVDLFSMIQSLDSIKLSDTLNRICHEKGHSMEVLIEVNTSGEDAKHGVTPDETENFACHILEECPSLALKGLMTVGPLGGDESAVRGAFGHLRQLREEASLDTGLEMPVLSMGMTSDFEWAIEEGSTMVRIGTGLFGKREY